jgi:hypothetical protein
MFRCSLKKATLLFPLLVTIVLSGLLLLIAYLPVSGVRSIILISLPLLSFSMFWFMRRYMKRYERADEQLQRQNEYLQALHETTLGLISRLDVAGLLQAIVTRSGSLVGTEHCYVYLKNAAGTEMEMAFQSGIYNKLRHYPIRPGQGVAGRIWDSGNCLMSMITASGKGACLIRVGMCLGPWRVCRSSPGRR